MAGQFSFFDETSGAQIMQGDSSGNVDIGNAAPTGPLSMDGTLFRKGSAAILGDALAPSGSSIKTTGSVSLGGSASSTITHSLGRDAFVIIAAVQDSNPVLLSDNNTTTFQMTNWDSSATHTGTYYYI